ncbi:MAG TPA: HRDC domain-containing protein [Longimicrobiales bacterium]|jgi:ribonuclease D
MSFTLIADDDALGALRRHLEGRSRVALDCEAAGFHRYSDRLCLLQVTAGERTFLVDPLAVDPAAALRPTLEDPDVTVVMHGADYDLRLLDRDLDIRLRGLFDTQIAAALLGEPGLGLAALLDKYAGVKLSKKFQRADWARRPLPDEMLDYAASDTRHLLPLADTLATSLRERGRLAWAKEEILGLEEVRWEADGNDPVSRVKGARDMDTREVAALREALAWRDEVARQRDRAPFRIAGDAALVEVVLGRPASVADLERVKGLNRGLVQSEGGELLRRIRAVEALEPSALVGFPRREGNGRGRPTPEVEERLERLKGARNRKAQELEIDRGTLLSNTVLQTIAWTTPRNPGDLAAIPGMRRWQIELLGDELMKLV